MSSSTSGFLFWGIALEGDAIEGPEGSMIHEINSKVEFHGASSASGVDVAGQNIDYLQDSAAN